MAFTLDAAVCVKFEGWLQMSEIFLRVTRDVVKALRIFL